MSASIVLTVTGPDRVGLVEEVTKALLDVGANVETSRMSRLGGEFAVLMLVAVQDGGAQRVEPALADLAAQGYRVSTAVTRAFGGTAYAGWARYRIEVRGADHEGIVHQIARELSQQGISIESAETTTTEAPVSGAPLFTMSAEVVVPPGAAQDSWMAALEDAAAASNVDIDISSM